jgi:hypothetical protein
VSHEVIVNLIAASTTRTGLRVQSQLDTGKSRAVRKEKKPKKAPRYERNLPAHSLFGCAAGSVLSFSLGEPLTQFPPQGGNRNAE